MPFYDAYSAELQLNTLMHRGRWEQALTAIDEWLLSEPWRTELLLRKAQLFRLLHRYEQGLAAVRDYRARKPVVMDVAFLEVDFLLEMGKATEALHQLDTSPPEQQATAQWCYYRGRTLLARREMREGMQCLWDAYQREPGFNRALLEWAAIAMQTYGKWWARRQLEALLARQRGNRTVAVSVALALNLIDARHGEHTLRRAVERYSVYVPATSRRVKRKSVAPVDGSTNAQGAADAYRATNEQLLAGHFEQGLDAYYQAVSADPSWMPVLAPLVAEVLVDELVRPEEARLLLEDAMRREPTDYRLHLSYTKVFLKLGFGEEALSSANCAYALAPDTEKAIALVQRAGARLLLKQHELALQDIQSALSHMPEARELISQEPSLRALARDRRFRALIKEQVAAPTLWERMKRWLVGE